LEPRFLHETDNSHNPIMKPHSKSLFASREYNGALLISGMIRLCLVLLSLSVESGVQAASLTDRLVLANKMLTLPPLGIGPAGGYYWWTVPVRPWDQSYSSRPSAWCSNLSAPDMTVQGYIEEINEAKAYGIDGFVVDITTTGPSDVASWTALVRAAATVGDFYVCLQPDLTTGTTPQNLKPFLDATATSPAYLKINNLPLVVPYAAGYGTAASEKTAWTDWYASQGLPISYIPSVFLDLPLYQNNDLTYKNPTTGYPAFASAITAFNPYHGDYYRQRAANFWQGSGGGTLPFMADMTFQYQNPAVAYVQNHGSQYFRNTFQWCINNRDKGVAWVQPLCWNDFHESAFAPNCNFFMALAPISKYYSDWFKTGTAPTVAKDSVSIFHRIYPHATFPSQYPHKFPDLGGTDEVEAVALLSGSAILFLQSGTVTYSAAVGPGVQSLLIPNASLGIQKAWVVRGGTTTATVTSPLPFINDPIQENVWWAGYGSAYPPESVPLTNWTTVSGTMSASGTTASGTGMSLVGDSLALIDYRVSASVTPSSASDATNSGVVVYADPGYYPGTGWGYFSFAVGKWSNVAGWRLSCVDNGVERVLLSGTTTYAVGQAHTLRLDKVGAYLMCYLDGTLVGHTADWGTPNLSYTDSRFSYGQGGVVAIGASASFSGILMERYQPNMSNIAAEPTFSPAPGYYATVPSAITISTATSGATIRYTTDGSTPTSTTGTVYSGPVAINSSTTLKAMAFKSGMYDSYLKSDDYIISATSQVATPTFNLAAGSYVGAQKVIISCATSGATIRYTTDGRTPTPLIGTVGTVATVGGSCTLKAIAYRNYLTDSAVQSVAYTITPTSVWIQVGSTNTSTYTTPDTGLFVPTFSSVGSIPSDFAVTGGVIPNMKVTYHLELAGSPNVGPLADGNDGLMLYGGATPDINAGLFTGVRNWGNCHYDGWAGNTGEPGPPEGLPYIFNNNGVGGVNPEKFDVTVEVYNGVVNTTVTTLSPAGYANTLTTYTTTAADATNWTGQMKFAAFRNSDAGHTLVSVSNLAFYRWANATNIVTTPSFSPAAGIYPNAQPVTISTSTPGASIRYTTDGSSPSDTIGTLYSGPITIGSNCTLKAVAYKSGMSYSYEASGDYTFQEALANAGFQSPNLAAGGYVYNPTGTGWTFTGLCGVASNGSPFTNGANAPSGTQVAFLQCAGSSISQQIGFTPGSYIITFQASQRSSAYQDFQVLVDGTVVGTFTPAYGSYQTYSTSPFTVTLGGHTITFLGLDTAGGDRTALIANVQVKCVPPTFSPVPGTYGTPQTVAISCASGGSTIRYTTDGTTPTSTTGTVYSTPVNIVGTQTLKAIAYKANRADSDVASGVYTITGVWIQVGSTNSNTYSTPDTRLSVPTFSSTGDIPSDFAITGGVIPNMKVTYHLELAGAPNTGYWSDGHDGLMLYGKATPDNNAGLFTGVANWQNCHYDGLAANTAQPGQPVGIPSYIFNNNGVGAVNPEKFDVTVEVYNGVVNTTVATLSPAGYANTLTTYTTTAADATNWTGQMKFAAFRTSDAPNTLVSVSNLAFYRWANAANIVATPTFSPAAGMYPNAQPVTISTSTSGASIRYTTDGSSPSDTIGTIYSGPITIGSNCTLKAVAYKSGMSYSYEASGNYTFQNALANTGFESPNVGSGYGAYIYNPTNAGWTFTGLCGVTGNGSAFTNPTNAPEGIQVAFLQCAGSSISQQIGFTPGSYIITFQASQRNSAYQDFQVLVDGAVVGTFTPTYGSYQTYSTSPFTVTLGGHTITFLGLDTAGGDRTALIDNVQIR
jgi:hypothetical protein